MLADLFMWNQLVRTLSEQEFKFHRFLRKRNFQRCWNWNSRHPRRRICQLMSLPNLRWNWNLRRVRRMNFLRRWTRNSFPAEFDPFAVFAAVVASRGENLLGFPGLVACAEFAHGLHDAFGQRFRCSGGCSAIAVAASRKNRHGYHGCA